MAKRYNEPIELTISADRQPRAFCWRGKQYRVESVIKRWTVNDEWWRQMGTRRFHAVVSARLHSQVGQYELVYEIGRHQWFLRSVFD